MSTMTRQSASVEFSLSAFATMTRKGRTLIIRPAGPRLGEGEATAICPEAKREIDDMGDAFGKMVLDLSEITVMSSYGLGMCIELRNHARSRHAEAVVYGMSADIRELFRIMKVDRLFTIAMSENDLANHIGD